ncbi:MAG: GNAT family N-acetyltransferase [Spirochaetia bacterium]|jgi:ribosomal protein S18 acetylase RimI-like enzyme|nr:GNAT family N-acetyltransferase [Spirochaetia bacterium]
MDVALTYRTDVITMDKGAVRSILESSGFFNKEEIDMGVSLVAERLEKGLASGYLFLFCEKEERAVGYTCYGHIDGTASSFDLFWIAVDQSLRGNGIGRELMRQTLEDIQRQGGTRVYVETSSTDLYQPTRLFYEKQGYICEGMQTDYYGPGDSKMLYVKVLS